MREGKRKGRVVFWVVYMLIMLGVGVLAGLFIQVWYGWILFMLALVPLVLGAERLDKKFWPKQCKEEASTAKPEWFLKKLVRTILQMFMGGAFGGGVVGLIFQLIYGGNVAPFLGLIGLSVALLVILSTVSALQDPEVKDEMETVKKEMKYYCKDERLKRISYKAGYICFGMLLLLLLLFGAVLAVFPPMNFNVIPLGILGIVGVSAVLFLVLFTLYDGEKLDPESKKPIRGGLLAFLLSLIPLALLGIRWVLAGLSGMGVTFFAVFLLVTVLLAWDLWFERKYR